MPRKSNLDEFKDEIKLNHSPIITYDIGTTGMMNGNDNRITQIALAAYEYNNNTKSYELQDKIFMLAKPDKQQLQTILDNEQPTPENIQKKAFSEYLYEIRSKIKNCENRMETFEKKIEKGVIPRSMKIYNKGKDKPVTLEEYYKLVYKNTNGRTYLEEQEYRERLTKLLNFVSDTKPMSIVTGYEDIYKNENLITLKDFIANNSDRIKQEMTDAIKMNEYMAKEGIDLKEYMNSDKGLTNAELQTGITEFLNKYRKDNSVFLTTNGYATRHYLEKQGLLITTKDDTTIDWANVVKSKSTAYADAYKGNINADKIMDLYEFVNLYNQKKDVSENLNTFDALTKCLCLAQLSMYASEINFSNTSKSYLENMVKEKAMSQDEGYVMSLTRASTLHWIPTSQSSYNLADYHFNSLEYINFGNDRRYIDIDKMFETNDNFEITLEGTKEPIKTWEELEAKIKALNSDISQELLDKIHQKYDEISKENENNKHDHWENLYYEGFLTLKNMTPEQEQYLNSVYNIHYEDDYEEDLDEEQYIEDYDLDYDENEPAQADIEVVEPVKEETAEEKILRLKKEYEEKQEQLEKLKNNLIFRLSTICSKSIPALVNLSEMQFNSKLDNDDSNRIYSISKYMRDDIELEIRYNIRAMHCQDTILITLYDRNDSVFKTRFYSQPNNNENWSDAMSKEAQQHWYYKDNNDVYIDISNTKDKFNVDNFLAYKDICINGIKEAIKEKQSEIVKEQEKTIKELLNKINSLDKTIEEINQVDKDDDFIME